MFKLQLKNRFYNFYTISLKIDLCICVFGCNFDLKNYQELFFKLFSESYFENIAKWIYIFSTFIQIKFKILILFKILMHN